MQDNTFGIEKERIVCPICFARSLIVYEVYDKKTKVLLGENRTCYHCGFEGVQLAKT
jgi:hypothetical protein